MTASAARRFHWACIDAADEEKGISMLLGSAIFQIEIRTLPSERRKLGPLRAFLRQPAFSKMA